MNKFILIFSATLILSLSACGGGGSDTGNTVTPPNQTPAAASNFFVVDTQNSEIGSVVDPNLPAGTLKFDRNISGSNTNLSGTNIRQLFYDKGHDDLYVANGSSVLVFSNASLATGNISPTRTISSSATTFITDMYLDITHDVLYIAMSSPDQVLAFNMASTANGDTTPDRTISISYNSGAFTITGLAVDASRDVLYVVGSSQTPTYSPAVLIYDGASKLSGTQIIYDRSISLPATAKTAKMFLDETNDRIYVSDFADFKIFVFDSVSMANGAITPTRSIKYTFGTPDIAYDIKNDSIITALSYGGGLWKIDSASTANGDVTPVTIAAPTGSYFRYPVVME